MTFARGQHITFAKQPDGSNATTANPTGHNTLDSHGQQQASESASFAGQNHYRGVLKGQAAETDPDHAHGGGAGTAAAADRADAIESLIQESIRVKQQFLNIQQMSYSAASRVDEDYTDEDDEDESGSSPYEHVDPEQPGDAAAHHRLESSHSDNVLAKITGG